MVKAKKLLADKHQLKLNPQYENTDFDRRKNTSDIRKTNTART